MPHNWQMLAVGRICTRCRLTQVKGEFDDDVPCPADRDDQKPAPQDSPQNR